MHERFRFLKSKWFLLGAGIVLGALALLAIRFFTYNPEHVHYHANFALYINGKREEFKGSQYYQDVAICSSTTGISTPQQRTHMHDDVNDVVHVHDHAVTWGQFFENLGWIIGPDFIATADGKIYQANDNEQLHIMINGQDYTGQTSITNTVIKDQSRLLISFGDIDDATLQKEAKTVASSAKHHDESKDPAACSSGETVSPAERLHHLF